MEGTNFTMLKPLNSLTLAHFLVNQAVFPGAAVVDATAGRGRDTAFLAQAVGQDGQVWAFDIQPEALESTAALLTQNHLTEQVTLVCAGHEHLAEYVHRPIAAAMFNLGYLPSGNKSLITRAETSLPALKAALDKLRPGGVVTLVVYTGHPGGAEEAAQLETFLESLSQHEFDVLKFTYPNRVKSNPYLIAIWKQQLEVGNV